jgi:serine/threonine protein kinase
MSSGTLPLATYHRAQSVGSGSYGAVLTVYNDDGEQFALKLFLDDSDDEEEEEHDSDDDDSEYQAAGNGMQLGALREISVLRWLRHQNGHENIIQIQDVQTEFNENEDNAGAGTEGYLGMAMPLFPLGSLASGLSMLSTKRQKLKVAHGLLSAVAFLHENGMLHRDIKADNILLEHDEDDPGEVSTNNKKCKKDDTPYYRPILIDFSLVKLIHPARVYDGAESWDTNHDDDSGELTHTADVGTPTYRAPEVVEREPYGFPSDLWSVGVVLLEVLRGSCLECFKDKTAFKQVDEALSKLPDDQPFPNLVRGLLEKDPSRRWTARQALESPAFQKFGFTTNPNTLRSMKNLHDAIPLDDEEEEDDGEDGEDKGGKRENESSRSNQTNTKKGAVSKPLRKKGPSAEQKKQKALAKRFQFIQTVCEHCEWTTNPLTPHAAFTYSLVMSQLEEDLDNLKESQGLLDCIVLAHKFFEREFWNLSELENGNVGAPYFEKYGWSAAQYVDNESTIFMMMDFCLFPRTLTEL